MGPVEAAEQGEGGGLVKKSPPHARTQAGALEGQGGGVVALDVQGGAAGPVEGCGASLGSWDAVEAWLDARGLRWRFGAGRVWVMGGVDGPAVLSPTERGELARLCALARGKRAAA